MSHPHPIELWMHVVEEFIADDCFATQCPEGHDILAGLSRRFFMCILKNTMTEANRTIKESQIRKTVKLNNDSLR